MIYIHLTPDYIPNGYSQFWDVSDLPTELPPMTVAVESDVLPAPFDVMMRQWRFVGDNLQDVGAPGKWEVWNRAESRWVFDLAGAQEEVWTSIKLKRGQVEFGGFTMDGLTFDSDVSSQSRIQGAALLAVVSKQTGAPFSTEWTLKDNSRIMLDADQMIFVGQGLAKHVDDTHTTGRLLRDQIMDATTVDQLENIHWPG